MLLERTLISMIVGVVALAPVYAEKPADNPKVKVEFRRAETKAAEGLTEAMVEGSREKIYLHKTVDLTTDDVAGARIALDNNKNATLEVSFTKAGAMKLTKLSKDHLDKPLAVLVDGKVISAPIIRGQIGDKAVISGSFTKEELEKIVQAINAK